MIPVVEIIEEAVAICLQISPGIIAVQNNNAAVMNPTVDMTQNIAATAAFTRSESEPNSQERTGSHEAEL